MHKRLNILVYPNKYPHSIRIIEKTTRRLVTCIKANTLAINKEVPIVGTTRLFPSTLEKGSDRRTRNYNRFYGYLTITVSKINNTDWQQHIRVHVVTENGSMSLNLTLALFV